MAKYIVNHGGIVHSCNDEDFALALQNGSRKPSQEDPNGKPAREATPQEVIAWYASQGLVYDPATDTAIPAADAAASEASKKASK